MNQPAVLNVQPQDNDDDNGEFEQSATASTRPYEESCARRREVTLFSAGTCDAR